MPMTFKRNSLGKVRTPPTGKEHVQRCAQVFDTMSVARRKSREAFLLPSIINHTKREHVDPCRGGAKPTKHNT